MITRMTDDMMDQLLTVWLEASTHGHDFISPEYWESELDSMRTVYIPNSETWVFRECDQVVGFYSIAGDVLAALFVLPEEHGRGVGTQLVRHAKDNNKCLELTVYIENATACDFYLNHGFSIIGRSLDEATGHEEYLMRWKSSDNQKK